MRLKLKFDSITASLIENIHIKLYWSIQAFSYIITYVNIVNIRYDSIMDDRFTVQKLEKDQNIPNDPRYLLIT